MPYEPMHEEPVMPAESPAEHVPLWKVIVPALIIVLVGVFGVNYYATSNVDYICTRTVNTEGVCSNGAWGAWTTVSTTTQNNIETTEQQRVYTGTRLLSRVVEYLNLRTSCADGFQQQAVGNWDGASGFHGGNVITVTQICQIAQSRAITRNLQTGEEDQTVAVITGETYGDTHEETVAINSFDQIDATLLRARRDAIALNISVEPNIVEPGGTTVVHWSSTEMTHCLVTADTNTDTWGSLTDTATTVLHADETSTNLQQEAKYTLKCVDFEGTPHEESAIVRLAPIFQEF